MCGRVPPLRPSFSLSQKRTPSCVASADAWLQMCSVSGEGTTPRVAGSSGFSGGGTTPVLPNLSIMSCRVSILSLVDASVCAQRGQGEDNVTFATSWHHLLNWQTIFFASNAIL